MEPDIPLIANYFADGHQNDFYKLMNQKFKTIPKGHWLKIHRYHKQISIYQEQQVFLSHICKYVADNNAIPPPEYIKEQIIPNCDKPLPEVHTDAAVYKYSVSAKRMELEKQVTQPEYQLIKLSDGLNDVEPCLDDAIVKFGGDYRTNSQTILQETQHTAYTIHTKTKRYQPMEDEEIEDGEGGNIHTKTKRDPEMEDEEMEPEEMEDTIAALMQRTENDMSTRRNYLENMFDVGIPFHIPITKKEFWVSVGTTFAVYEWILKGLDVYSPQCASWGIGIRILVAVILLVVHAGFAIWNIDSSCNPWNKNGYYTWKQAIGHVCFLLWQMLAVSESPWICFGIDENKYGAVVFWGFGGMIVVGGLLAICKTRN